MKICIHKLTRDLNSFTKEADSVYHTMALKYKISDSVLYILYAITELGDGCCQKDISEAFSICKQTINSSIRNLQKEGFIDLKSVSGNQLSIFLTRKGKKLVKEKINPVIQIENKVAEKFSNEEQVEFLRLMKKYTSLLREEAGKIDSV